MTSIIDVGAQAGRIGAGSSYAEAGARSARLPADPDMSPAKSRARPAAGARDARHRTRSRACHGAEQRVTHGQVPRPVKAKNNMVGAAAGLSPPIRGPSPGELRRPPAAGRGPSRETSPGGRGQRHQQEDGSDPMAETSATAAGRGIGPRCPSRSPARRKCLPRIRKIRGGHHPAVRGRPAQRTA